jgi:type IV secretion system protein VirD4
MTPNVKNALWFRAVALFAVLACLAVAWLWLGGYFFLKAAGAENVRASPLTLWRYYATYGDDPETRKWLALAALGALAALAAPLAAIFAPKPKKLYGSARWATMKEIEKAGLAATNGVVVGKIERFFGLYRRYLIFSGAAHTLMTAETRDGKGVGVVIPTLLSWPDSAVVLDVKKENWEITAGFRQKHGQECYLLNFAPQDKRSHRWNPLAYVSDDPDFTVNDIQKIGATFFPDRPGEAPIWQASARSLWLGIVLYLRETEGASVTVAEALRQVMAGDERLQRIVDERQEGAAPLSETCYLALKEYLDTPEKTRGSIRKSFTSALEIFANPVVEAATSANDFDLRELRKKRMTVYVNLSVDDIKRLRPAVNAFFQQVVEINTRELPEQNPDLKHKCLILADEFASLGRADMLAHGISYIAGYGLRLLTIVQSLSQIRDLYGQNADTFIQNHTIRVFFSPADNQAARELSEALGNTTVKNKSHSRQLGVADPKGSVSIGKASRPLMLPQELKNMGEKSAIILAKHCPPILCRKIRWFEDAAFARRGRGRDGSGGEAPDVPALVAIKRDGALVREITAASAANKKEAVENVAPRRQGTNVEKTAPQERDTSPVSEDEVANVVDVYYR